MMRRVAVAVALVVGVLALCASAASALTCGDFQAQAQAQQFLRSDPTDPNGLDADHNGIACDAYSYPAGRPADLTPVSRSARSAVTAAATSASAGTASGAGAASATPARSSVATAAASSPSIAGSVDPLAKTGLVHTRQFVLVAILLLATGAALLSGSRAAELAEALRRLDEEPDRS